MDLGRLLSYQGLRYVPSTDRRRSTGLSSNPQTYNPYPPTHPYQDENRSLTARTRHLITLSIAEVRRLFNLIDKDDHAIDHGLRWPAWRREHQADTRQATSNAAYDFRCE
jgi:hypothetical protein